MLIRQTARRIITATSRRAFYAVKKAWLQRMAARHNSTLAKCGRYTVAEFLRRVIGASEAFIAANAVKIGKAAAKAHRELFGMGPAQEGLTVIGNHPRFTAIATYGPSAYSALETAASRIGA